ncbi:MAG: deoxynucleoside kinase [Anaerolineales bacterium]|nr:deoxynucleoside kinase [Anaerolineales bacterium]MCA9931523.1 deoxynucleoside kinase [Anaerolineales bacterium]
MTKYFITIAGNIGVGKSTLVKLLAARNGWDPVFESVTENPYLADFYENMPRWSFHSQVFFLSRRLQQHHELLQRKNSVIQDRSVYEDAEIFAKNLMRQGAMSERDWGCYDDLYQTLGTMLQPPHLVIYLKASVATLRRRIQMRGRDFEQQISDNYLEQLNILYDEWAESFTLSPVLTVDTNQLDYVQHDEHLNQIWQIIDKRLKGRDYLSLR